MSNASIAFRSHGAFVDLYTRKYDHPHSNKLYLAPQMTMRNRSNLFAALFLVSCSLPLMADDAPEHQSGGKTNADEAASKKLASAFMALQEASKIAAANRTPEDIRRDRQRGIEHGKDGMLNEYYPFREEFYAKHPELLDVDPYTESGKEKIEEVFRKDMETKVDEDQLAESNRKLRIEIQPSLGMNLVDFKAIDPILRKVLLLNSIQQSIMLLGKNKPSPTAKPYEYGVDMSSIYLSMFSISLASKEPSAKNLFNAMIALAKILRDPQASDAEVNAAMDHVRKARVDFQAVRDKAEGELRAVLTRRQQGVLVEMEVLAY